MLISPVVDLARLAADWVPTALKPSLAQLAARLGGPPYIAPIRWAGNYATYAEARAASGGYSTHDIVEAAVRRAPGFPLVPNGPTHLTPQHARLVVGVLTPLLTLNRVPRILDFGGVLGFHFAQLRAVLPNSIGLDWIVWETPSMVAAAQELTLAPELRFITAAEQLGDWRPDVIVTSGTLHYVEDPHESFRTLARLGAESVFIDRLPLIPGRGDRLTVQHVRPPIYSGSYPVWFLAEEPWLALLQDQYRIAMRWEGPESATLDGKSISYFGFVLHRR